MRLRFVVFAGVVVALIAAAMPALAHRGNPYARAEVARHKNGPWFPTSIGVKVATGDKKNVYVRIKNTTSGPKHRLDMNLTEAGGGGPPEYHNAWFSGENDITHSVQTSGYDFKLKPEKMKRFRLRITAHDDSAQECVYAHFHLQPHDLDMYIGFHVNGGAPCVV
jgi:hypothetical protein